MYRCAPPTLRPLIQNPTIAYTPANNSCYSFPASNKGSTVPDSKKQLLDLTDFGFVVCFISAFISTKVISSVKIQYHVFSS